MGASEVTPPCILEIAEYLSAQKPGKKITELQSGRDGFTGLRLAPKSVFMKELQGIQDPLKH
jgi:hypothetical protein